MNSNEILRYLIDPDIDKYRDCRSIIYANLTADVFRDEEFVVFSVFSKFKEKNIALDSEFLELYLTRHLSLLIDADGKQLDLAAYASLAKDRDPSLMVGGVVDSATLYITGVLEWFEEMLGTPAPDPSTSDLMLKIEKFKQLYCVNSAQEVLQKGLAALTTSYQEGLKVYSGFSEAKDFVQRGLNHIEGILNTQSGIGYISYNELLEKKEETRPVNLVGTFAGINELNKHFGGLYTQSLVTVAAPNKGGKTKFCMNLVYDAVVNHGKNVTLWAVEGSIQEMMAELQVIHFDRTFNSGASPEDSKLGIDKYTVLHNTWKNRDWIEEFELTSRELGENPKYGRIDFIDKPLYLESFVDDLNVSVEGNGSELVVIDYLSLGASLNPRLEEHTIIKRLYQQASAYCKRQNICLVSPAQYTQETIKSLAKNSESQEMRASIGGSAEILRSSDLAFALWADTQDLLDNRMSFLSLPSRTSRPFESFEIMTDLGVCLFMSKR